MVVRTEVLAVVGAAALLRLRLPAEQETRLAHHHRKEATVAPQQGRAEVLPVVVVVQQVLVVMVLIHLVGMAAQGKVQAYPA